MLFFLLTCIAMQLSTPSLFKLSGHIEAGRSTDIHQLRIQLIPLGGSRIVTETNPSTSGGFELQSEAGLHELRISSMRGDTIHTQFVNLPFAGTLTIRLTQDARPESDPKPVSLFRLQHKIPKKAVREFVNAAKASAKGKPTEAIAHLEKALTIDPDYFEALNNLGVQLVRTGDVEAACKLFERATKLDPSDSMAETNLAFTLLKLNRYAEAESAARAALRVDRHASKPRYFLALSLLEQNKPKEEVLFHLEKASPDYEPARTLLEELRELRGLSR